MHPQQTHTHQHVQKKKREKERKRNGNCTHTHGCENDAERCSRRREFATNVNMQSGRGSDVLLAVRLVEYAQTPALSCGSGRAVRAQGFWPSALFIFSYM